MKRRLYLIQERLALTETEARALAVVLLMFITGLVARHVQRHWSHPGVPENPFITQVAGAGEPGAVYPSALDTNNFGGDSLKTASPADTVSGGGHARAAPKGGLIDVNEASETELRTLPGIGPALAGRIVRYRTENGPFASSRDLLSVKGIGEKTLARLAPLITASTGRKPGG